MRHLGASSSSPSSSCSSFGSLCLPPDWTLLSKEVRTENHKKDVDDGDGCHDVSDNDEEDDEDDEAPQLPPALTHY